MADSDLGWLFRGYPGIAFLKRRCRKMEEEEKKFEPKPYWTGPGYRGEYQCLHGVGHGNHIHGCDGCCSRPDYPLKEEKDDG